MRDARFVEALGVYFANLGCKPCLVKLDISFPRGIVLIDSVALCVLVYFDLDPTYFSGTYSHYIGLFNKLIIWKTLATT